MSLRELDEVFMDMAEAAAVKATCLHLQVGAVIVRECWDSGNPHILGVGYNTAPKGMVTCKSEHKCLKNEEGRCIRTIHAETAAILSSERQFLQGATLYVTHEPCEHCAKMIKEVGIKTVVYKNSYTNLLSQHFREEVDYIHLQ